MASQGYRTVDENGRVVLDKEFREEHDLESGDKIYWKRHSRNSERLIISTEPFEE